MKRMLPKCLLLLWLAAFLLCACQNGEQPPQQQTQRPTADAPQPPDPSLPPDRTPLYPPAPDLPPEPNTLRIAVISDINGSYGTVGYGKNVTNAVRDIVQKKYDFVLSPGDLVAGQKAGLDYDAMWRAFHFNVGDVFFDNNMEFIMAPGNHDASAYPSFIGERYAYARAFRSRLPRAPLLPGSNFPFYYAVRLRGILVVALDITRPISNNDPQLDWLESLLSNHPNERATLVLGHLPLTPVNIAQFWETAGSSRLIDMLQRHPRSLYISGHHHIFYPGHIGELRTIACPALGSGARSLFGEQPVSGYVQLTVPPHAPIRVTARVSPDFSRMIDIKKLPEMIISTQREDVGISNYIIEMIDDSAKIR